MHARPVPAAYGTGHVARAAFRGAAGFLLFVAITVAVLVGILVVGIVAGAVFLSHLPADTLPPPGR